MGYIERKSLKWVNNHRVDRGFEPLAKLPRGRKRDPHGCVIHRALEDVDFDNTVSGYGVSINNRNIGMPWYIRLMIITFDLGLRPRQDIKRRGYDELVYAKDVLSLKDKFEMWRERRRVEKEMRLEREQALLDSLAASLAAKAEWKKCYTDVWMAEHLKREGPVITDDLQALYEMEPYEKEEGKVVV